MIPMVRKLIAKELYINRWLMGGATASGLAALWLASTSEMGFNIGLLAWLTAIIGLGVMLAMYGVFQERKDRTLLFVLSLPLSRRSYVVAKLFGLFLCFLLPWLALSVGAIVLILAVPGIPNGMLPFAVLMCGFLLANFSLVLGGTLVTTSEGLVTAIIIVTNMMVSVFIFVVGGMEPIRSHLQDAAPVWNAAVWTVLACELALLIFSLALPFALSSHRRDI